MRERGDALEDRQQVLRVGHEVAEDDVVEGRVEIDLLAGGDDELELGMAAARELDHAGADVDADAAGRLQRRQQVARPAADLEHARARRDVEAADGLHEPVVGAVACPPARLRGREAVEEARERVVVRAGCLL